MKAFRKVKVSREAEIQQEYGRRHANVGRGSGTLCPNALVQNQQ